LAPARAEGAARRAGPREASSLKQLAYDAIKKLIVTHALKPGELMNEQMICERLDIGRTPVHQAIQLLHAQGFITIIPRKGLIISPDSLETALAVLEARMVVETRIAGLAAERATPALVEAMERALADGRAAIKAEAFEAFMVSDQAFHAAIGQAAANPILVEMMQALHERAARIWHVRAWKPEDLKKTQAEHLAIFRAIGERDGAAAAKAMEAHVDSLRRRVLRSAA
jgi:DNA-binding GntR family transcriptional regulator